MSQSNEAGVGPLERPVRPVAEALERLRYVDREIWNDITSALEDAKEDHCSPDMDEMDCTLLLDLLWLYRHAEPLLNGKASQASAAIAEAVAAERERCAKLCDEYHKGSRYDADSTGSEVASWLAAEIRRA